MAYPQRGNGGESETAGVNAPNPRIIKIFGAFVLLLLLIAAISKASSWLVDWLWMKEARLRLPLCASHLDKAPPLRCRGRPGVYLSLDKRLDRRGQTEKRLLAPERPGDGGHLRVPRQAPQDRLARLLHFPGGRTPLRPGLFSGLGYLSQVLLGRTLRQARPALRAGHRLLPFPPSRPRDSAERPCLPRLPRNTLYLPRLCGGRAGCIQPSFSQEQPDVHAPVDPLRPLSHHMGRGLPPRHLRAPLREAGGRLRGRLRRLPRRASCALGHDGRYSPSRRPCPHQSETKEGRPRTRRHCGLSCSYARIPRHHPGPGASVHRAAQRIGPRETFPRAQYRPHAAGLPARPRRGAPLRRRQRPYPRGGFTQQRYDQERPSVGLEAGSPGIQTNSGDAPLLPVLPGGRRPLSPARRGLPAGDGLGAGAERAGPPAGAHLGQPVPGVHSRLRACDVLRVRIHGRPFAPHGSQRPPARIPAPQDHPARHLLWGIHGRLPHRENRRRGIRLPPGRQERLHKI